MKGNLAFSTGLTKIIRLKNKPTFQRLRPSYLKVVKTLQEKGRFIYDSLTFISNSGIYQPTSTSSSLFVLKHLPKFTEKAIAEIGTGCGIIAVAMAKLGNAVTASDICENSIEAARNNAELNYVDLELLKSDLFKNFEPSQKFDCIIFNSPFMDKEVDCKEDRALCDPKGRLVKKFISEAVSFLKSDGKIFLATANIANLDIIRKTMKKNNLIGHIVGKDVDAETGIMRFLLSIQFASEL